MRKGGSKGGHSKRGGDIAAISVKAAEAAALLLVARGRCAGSIACGVWART